MPNWNHILVGNAFKLSSRDPNYYRDLFLLPPFLIFSVIAVIALFSRNDHAVGLKFLALATGTLLLARERLILLAGALGFWFLRLLGASLFVHDRRVWLALIATGAALLGLIPFAKNYRPSYEWPQTTYISDVLIGMLSFGLTLLVSYKLTH